MIHPIEGKEAVDLTCDRCGDSARVDTDDEALARDNAYGEGWRQVAGMDLCPLCSRVPAPARTACAECERLRAALDFLRRHGVCITPPPLFKMPPVCLAVGEVTGQEMDPQGPFAWWDGEREQEAQLFWAWLEDAMAREARGEGYLEWRRREGGDDA
ncbi:MAG: hypothetical protein PHZ19_03935 [Candidatus Thermoplasmatota archaeon]|nr:hypothetical protein [Candidatus Thermoplasmatota archaeon]